MTGKKLTTEEFIEKSRNIHGDRYSYDSVVYKNTREKVEIICLIHGSFWQSPSDHLAGCGCPECSNHKRLDTESFIKKAKVVHGNKYDYSKTVYINSKEEVCIICPIHSEFWQTPNRHLGGHGCKKCAKVNSPTTHEFIESANKVHNNKYIYNKTNYINSRTKVIITCPIHGDFEQLPNHHLKGSGCPKCGRESAKNKMTSNTEEFIEKASIVHNNTYDYSKVEYVNDRTKVCIICPIHGEFWQTPNQHLRGAGCSKCSGTYSPTTEEFIERAKVIHSNRYDYSKVEYTNKRNKICIICSKHGEFWQIPEVHLNGSGCPECAKEDQKNINSEFRRKMRDSSTELLRKFREIHGDKYEYNLTGTELHKDIIKVYCKEHDYYFNIKVQCHLLGTGCPICGKGHHYGTEEFIMKANLIHNNKYDYSKTEYKGSNNPVLITCADHGEFLQMPQDHLSGCGCPKCASLKSQLNLFEWIKVSFPNETWEWEYSPKWLGLQRFDIYNKKYNIAIEYNGRQHYVPVKKFGGEIGFQETLERDNKKKEKCKNNDCYLYVIKYDDVDYEKIKEDITNIIKNKSKHEN